MRPDRRHFLKSAAVGCAGLSLSPLGSRISSAWEERPPEKKPKRKCLLLWMVGGPSQLDTFDLKPGHANGGEFKPMPTKVPGIQISEHLPQIGQWADQLAIVRSLSTKEGDHGRGTYLVRTGHQPQGPVRYPSIGALVSNALRRPELTLPQQVSINAYRIFNQDAFGPGFLGPSASPLVVGASDAGLQPAGEASNAASSYAQLKVEDVAPAANLSTDQLRRRQALWQQFESDFVATHRHAAPLAHQTTYDRAWQMMHSDAAKAFDLDEEPAAVRDRYGKGRFGQGCLMARRMLERDVPFVEVTLGSIANNAIGWDTHLDNFRAVKELSAELDAGWGTLLSELADRGLLEETTILWIGEFGRTPKINAQGGRDHFPNAWSCVLGGGGIHGGQVYGKTTADGMEVDSGKCDIGDVLATLFTALGIDPSAENISPERRPIKLAEGNVLKGVAG